MDRHWSPLVLQPDRQLRTSQTHPAHGIRHPGRRSASAPCVQDQTPWQMIASDWKTHHDRQICGCPANWNRSYEPVKNPEVQRKSRKRQAVIIESDTSPDHPTIGSGTGCRPVRSERFGRSGCHVTLHLLAVRWIIDAEVGQGDRGDSLPGDVVEESPGSAGQGWSVTPTGREARESATENTPPMVRFAGHR